MLKGWFTLGDKKEQNSNEEIIMILHQRLKKADLEIATLKDRLNKSLELLDKTSKEKDLYNQEMRKIAQNLCGKEYSLVQLGGQNVRLDSPEDLSDYIIKNVQKQLLEKGEENKNLQKHILTLTKKLQETQEFVAKLLSQQQQQQSKQVIETKIIQEMSKPINKEQQSVDVVSEQILKPEPTQQQAPIIPGINDVSSLITIELMEDYTSKMDDTMWAIVRAIGEKGLCEVKVIRDEVMEIMGPLFQNSSFQSGIQRLRNMNIINQDIKINTGIRTFNAQELTEKGKTMYKMKYSQDPVLPQHRELLQYHGSFDHGYTIKDAADILESIWGFKEITIDRKTNRIETGEGKQAKIFDIIAKDKNGKTVYFEVELGTHTEPEYMEMFEKMRKITNDLNIITRNKAEYDMVLNYFTIWQQSMEKTGSKLGKNYTIRITPLNNLKQKSWLFQKTFN